MNLYTFKLESFHISNTRSRHDDTDTVTFGLQVGTQQFPIQSHFSGDINNGDYPVNLAFGPVLITGATLAVVFTYQIYNGGAGNLPKSLVSLNQALLNQVVPLVMQTTGTDSGNWPNLASGDLGQDVPDAGGDDDDDDDGPDFADTADWSTIIYEALIGELGSFIFPDCDGFVAADGIGLGKAQWDKLINAAQGQTLRKTMSYAGTNSPAGCGGNSNYTVTWSITRKTVSGSVRQFLKANALTLHPGFRSLTQP